MLRVEVFSETSPYILERKINAAFLNDMAQKQTKPAEWYEGKYKAWVNDSTRYEELVNANTFYAEELQEADGAHKL